MFYRIIAISSFLFFTTQSYADRIGIRDKPSNTILRNTDAWGLNEVLAFVEAFLLKVVLPIVIIGSALYIAFRLFMAEGNEEENKKAWKALTYAVIGVVCIMLSYAIIAIVQRINV